MSSEPQLWLTIKSPFSFITNIQKCAIDDGYYALSMKYNTAKSHSTKNEYLMQLLFQIVTYQLTNV